MLLLPKHKTKHHFSISLLRKLMAETNPNPAGEDEQQQMIELPPGFRFHPTDEELITHYLSHKVVDNNFDAVAIGEADLNKSEPWDLPGRAKMGEKEWYFFCIKDRKYPTGLRTNRATECGYWKATGKDKEILRGKSIVGMKKTLVFYIGRAPKGDKSNWVMHEYRLDHKSPLISPNPPTKNEWVICRIFNKSSGVETDRNSPALPPLMEFPHSQAPYSGEEARAQHVTCFSNNPIMNETKPYTNNMFYNFNTDQVSSSSAAAVPPPLTGAGNSMIVRMLLENPTARSGLMKVNPKVEINPSSQYGNEGIGMMEEDRHNPSWDFDDPIGLESLWNY